MKTTVTLRHWLVGALTMLAASTALVQGLAPTSAGTAMLSYFLPVAGAVRAEVYDVAGRRVVGLAARERQVVGPHTLAVPALAPGLYTVRLEHEGGAAYRKLVVE